MVGNARELHPDIAWPVPPKTVWRIRKISMRGVCCAARGHQGFDSFPKLRLHTDISVTC